MNENAYLIPANAKRGSLIFNIFRPVDLIILGIGLAITIVALIMVDTQNIINVIIACLPLMIAVLLVTPVVNHHNVLVVLISIFEYYYYQHTYKWKGWCVYEQDTK